MKITDIEVITFRAPGGRSRPSKWGYGIWGEEQKESASSIFKICCSRVKMAVDRGEGKSRVHERKRKGEDPPPVKHLGSTRHFSPQLARSCLLGGRWRLGPAGRWLTCPYTKFSAVPATK